MEEVVPIAKYIMEYLEKKSIYAQFIDPKDARQYCDPNYFLDSYSNDLPCHLQLFDKTKEMFPGDLSSLDKIDFLDADSKL
jgi:hypothetical protein